MLLTKKIVLYTDSWKSRLVLAGEIWGYKIGDWLLHDGCFSNFSERKIYHPFLISTFINRRIRITRRVYQNKICY